MTSESTNFGGPVRREDALASGLTRRQIQSKRFRSLARGVLIDASVPLDLRARCEAIGLVTAEGSVFSHHTAAELYGAPIAKDPLLHVSLKSAVEPRIDGVVAHRVLELGPVWRRYGQPVTSPGRTFVDLASKLDLPSLVAVGDPLLRLPDARETFAEALQSGSKRRGIRLARQAFPLLHPGADSAPESHLRLFLTLAGFPPDGVNEPKYDPDGTMWAKPDLEYCVDFGLEYEGAHHRDDPRQWERDARRDARYADRGWYLMKVTKEMLYQHREELLAAVAQVLRRRGWRPR